ncbi:hypothetical protein [Faecalitalea cylindroides]|uniref:hypothetical protein n=1 Tax=Faecalitalea cylindroides TaxID=39483 RepID=UPI0039F536E2
METNNVFRLNLKTGSAENYVDPDELFEHCLEKNIIGVGWSVDEPVNSIEEWIKEGEKKYNSRSFIRAANNMNRIEEDDLIWIRNHGTYYLCRAEGKAKIEYDKEHDLFCVVQVCIARIGTMEKIPAKIRNSFISRSAIQRVYSNTDYNEIELISKLLYNNHIKKGEKYSLSNKKVENPVKLLQSETIEEILGLYLQEQEYYIFSGTNKLSTQTYEYVAVNKDEPHEKIYTQVKTGGATININEFKNILDNEKDSKLYYYAEEKSNEVASSDYSNRCKYISPDVLNEFIKAHRKIVPEYVNELFDLIDNQSKSES